MNLPHASIYPIDGPPLGSHDRHVLNVLRSVGLAGLVAANLYGWTMIQAGFLNTRLLPESSLGHFWVATIMSAFVQAGIFGFYLAMPYQKNLSFVPRAFLTFFWFVLVALGVIFSFYSITLSADRTNIMNWHKERVTAVSRDVANVDRQISATFTQHLAGLNQSRIEACNGRDETGIRICGPIAAGFLNRGTSLRNQFGAQLTPSVISAVADNAGAFERASQVQSNVDALRPKVEAFARFGELAGVDTSATRRLYTSITSTVAQIRADFGDQAPDALSLVLARAFQNLGGMFTASVSPDVYLAGLIACLPDLLSLVFVLLLMVDQSSRGGGSLRKMINDAEKQTRGWDRLRDVWKGLFTVKVEAMGERMKNEAVDAVAAQPPKPGDEQA